MTNTSFADFFSIIVNYYNTYNNLTCIITFELLKGNIQDLRESIDYVGNVVDLDYEEDNMNKDTIYRTLGPALIIIALVPISQVATRMAPWWGRLFLVVSLLSLVMLYVGLDPTKRVYSCEHCKKSFKLSLWQKLASMRFSQKRYLTCPHCKKSGWAKLK